MWFNVITPYMVCYIKSLIALQHMAQYFNIYTYTFIYFPSDIILYFNDLLFYKCVYNVQTYIYIFYTNTISNVIL